MREEAVHIVGTLPHKPHYDHLIGGASNSVGTYMLPQDMWLFWYGSTFVSSCIYLLEYK